MVGYQRPRFRVCPAETGSPPAAFGGVEVKMEITIGMYVCLMSRDQTATMVDKQLLSGSGPGRSGDCKKTSRIPLWVCPTCHSQRSFLLRP